MQRGQKEKSIKMKSKQDFILPAEMNKCRLAKRTSHPGRDHSAPSTLQPLGLLLLNLGPPPIVHNTHCSVTSSSPNRQERKKEVRGMLKFKTIMTALCISLNFLFTTFSYDNKNECLGERFFFFFLPSTSRISCLVESRNDLYYPSLVSFLARHTSGLTVSSWQAGVSFSRNHQIVWHPRPWTFPSLFWWLSIMKRFTSFLFVCFFVCFLN